MQLWPKRGNIKAITGLQPRDSSHSSQALDFSSLNGAVSRLHTPLSMQTTAAVSHRSPQLKGFSDVLKHVYGVANRQGKVFASSSRAVVISIGPTFCLRPLMPSYTVDGQRTLDFVPGCLLCKCFPKSWCCTYPVRRSCGLFRKAKRPSPLLLNTRLELDQS